MIARGRGENGRQFSKEGDAGDVSDEADENFGDERGCYRKENAENRNINDPSIDERAMKRNPGCTDGGTHGRGHRQSFGSAGLLNGMIVIVVVGHGVLRFLEFFWGARSSKKSVGGSVSMPV